MWNGAHLHVIVVHFVVAFFFAGLILTVFARVFEREKGLRYATLVVALLTMILGITARFTGPEAAELAALQEQVDQNLIHEHEEQAEWIWFVVLAIGMSAVWWGISGRRRPGGIPSHGAWWVMFELFVGGAVLIGWLSQLGGRISHPTARPEYSLPVQVDEWESLDAQ